MNRRARLARTILVIMLIISAIVAVNQAPRIFPGVELQITLGVWSADANFTAGP